VTISTELVYKPPPPLVAVPMKLSEGKLPVPLLLLFPSIEETAVSEAVASVGSLCIMALLPVVALLLLLPGPDKLDPVTRKKLPMGSAARH
jgi:hypothetical protein